jgi:hypothetical protein
VIGQVPVNVRALSNARRAPRPDFTLLRKRAFHRVLTFLARYCPPYNKPSNQRAPHAVNRNVEVRILLDSQTICIKQLQSLGRACGSQRVVCLLLLVVQDKCLLSSKRGRQERGEGREDQDGAENRSDDRADQQRYGECPESYHRHQNAEHRHFES